VVHVDLDSTHRQVYGYAKEGAAVGRHKGKKTLHPLIASVSTPLARPVVTGIRLRRGKAADVRGAARFLAETLAVVHRPDHRPPGHNPRNHEWKSRADQRLRRAHHQLHQRDQDPEQSETIIESRSVHPGSMTVPPRYWGNLTQGRRPSGGGPAQASR
jgi:hypothetical protein